MTKTTEEIIREIYEEPVMKNLSKDMTPADKKIIDDSLQAFVNDFVLPIMNGLEAIAANPEASEELKKQLAGSRKDVIRLDTDAKS